MDIREKKLYHQIHPLKLATDIGVTPLSLYFVREHRVLPAVLVGFVYVVVAGAKRFQMAAQNICWSDRHKNSPKR